MTLNQEQLNQLIEIIADYFSKEADLEPDMYSVFFQSPQLSIDLINLLDSLDEKKGEDDSNFLSACIYCLEITISQLQCDIENGGRRAQNLLNKCMHHLASVMQKSNHSLTFWLPALNAFYDSGIELIDELKNAYLDLIEENGSNEESDEDNHIEAIRQLIIQNPHLTVFDIAENFFSQTYAMPAEFFYDLIQDLLSIEEGYDVALLFLLHPNYEIREVIIDSFNDLLSDITLSSLSLSRLQAIQKFYPDDIHPCFNAWIKNQRKKGVVFTEKKAVKINKLKATEVDGAGSQGIFIHVSQNRQHRMCGLLLKQEAGIKDCWLTNTMRAKDIEAYYHESFDFNVALRNIDLPYLVIMVNHFLAVTIERAEMPNLQFLQLQEVLNIQFKPQKINPQEIIENIAVEIQPFTQDTIKDSTKRSKHWTKTKTFTESWFIESAQIDKLVNSHCSIVDGIKVCDLNLAEDKVLHKEMEKFRDKWFFHFLWMALWARAHHRKNERVWQDCFIICYLIHQGTPLKEIPLFNEICHQSVLNSVETMQERGTYLS
jgi:hypothetical protein